MYKLIINGTHWTPVSCSKKWIDSIFERMKNQNRSTCLLKRKKDGSWFELKEYLEVA